MRKMSQKKEMGKGGSNREGFEIKQIVENMVPY